MSETSVVSFIVRFIQEETDEPQPIPHPWRGLIRHVHTDQERRFTHITEALQFMGQFVDIDLKSET